MLAFCVIPVRTVAYYGTLKVKVEVVCTRRLDAVLESVWTADE